MVFKQVISKHSNFNFTKIRDPWFDRQRRYEAHIYQVLKRNYYLASHLGLIIYTLLHITEGRGQ